MWQLAKLVKFESVVFEELIHVKTIMKRLETTDSESVCQFGYMGNTTTKNNKQCILLFTAK